MARNRPCFFVQSAHCPAWTGQRETHANQTPSLTKGREPQFNPMNQRHILGPSHKHTALHAPLSLHGLCFLFSGHQGTHGHSACINRRSSQKTHQSRLYRTDQRHTRRKLSSTRTECRTQHLSDRKPKLFLVFYSPDHSHSHFFAYLLVCFLFCFLLCRGGIRTVVGREIHEMLCIDLHDISIPGPYKSIRDSGRASVSPRPGICKRCP